MCDPVCTVPFHSILGHPRPSITTRYVQCSQIQSVFPPPTCFCLYLLPNRRTRKKPLSTRAESQLRNKAQATQAGIKQQQGENSNAYSVLDHPASTQDTDSRCCRPEHQEEVNWYPGHGWNIEDGEEGRDDEREECVADDTHALREGS